jgi:glycosyltransferase involved in cell wall biosynthesis
LADSHYRRLRRFLSPLHPNRLLARLRHAANKLGWHHVVFWASGLAPRRLLLSWRWLAAKRAAQAARRRDPRLKVAVDVAPFWEPLTGIGWYLYRLLEHLADRPDLALRLYGPAFVDKGDQRPPVVPLPRGRAIELVRYQVPEGFSLPFYLYADWLRARAHQEVEADGNDLYFAPNFFLPPPMGRCRGRLVATVHDLGFRKLPETLRESTREELERHLESTLGRATAILTDSEAVRGELVETGLVPPGKVQAVHLAAASVHGAKACDLPAGTPRRYLLFVGTLEPRKGVGNLLAAWRRLKDEPGDPATEMALVLAGGIGWKSEALVAALAAAEGSGVRHYGYLPEAELIALYDNAEWLVFPSRYEGFGLPAVEAMAAGVPLLLSDLPVLRELAGDAALYAPPGDLEAWVALLRRVCADAAGSRELRAEYARRSRERSAHFDWRRTAEETAAVFFKAAGRREAT